MAPAITFLALVAVAGLGFGWYDYSRINENQQTMAAQTTHMKTTQDGAAQQIAALDQRVAQEDSSNAGLQSDLNVVTKRLRLTQGELKTARDEAVQTRADSEQKIADLDATIIRPRRKDEPGNGPNLAPIRQRIESIFQTCKDLLTLERHGAPGDGGLPAGSPSRR